jgi:hypothetical protein
MAMDATLTLTLSISILINILTLRWAWREHAARKHYQQETQILRRALRGNRPDGLFPVNGFDRLIVGLAIAIVLLGVFWWSFQ